MNQEIRKEYEQQLFLQHRGQKDMVDYYMKECQLVVKTSKGYFIAIRKPSIKKNFCFGESGYDYHEAQQMAQVARTNEEYFMRENLDQIDDTITKLQDLNMTAYTVKYSEKSDIRQLLIVEPSWMYTYPWLKFESEQGHLEELTKEDRKLLIDAHFKVRADFEKRLHTYLKKYGLKHINSWTFWRDA